MFNIGKKTTLFRKEITFHYSYVIIVFQLPANCLNNAYDVGIKVPGPAHLCCCKTWGAEGFIIRRLRRDTVCVDGLVKLWGKLFTLR